MSIETFPELLKATTGKRARMPIPKGESIIPGRKRRKKKSKRK